MNGCRNSSPGRIDKTKKVVKPANMVAVEELVNLTYKYISDCREISSRFNKTSSFVEGGMMKPVSKDDKLDVVLSPAKPPFNFDDFKNSSKKETSINIDCSESILDESLENLMLTPEFDLGVVGGDTTVFSIDDGIEIDPEYINWGNPIYVKHRYSGKRKFYINKKEVGELDFQLRLLHLKKKFNSTKKGEL